MQSENFSAQFYNLFRYIMNELLRDILFTTGNHVTNDKEMKIIKVGREAETVYSTFIE